MKKNKKDNNEPHYVRLIYASLLMDEPILHTMCDFYFGNRGQRGTHVHPAVPLLYLLYLLNVRPRHDE